MMPSGQIERIANMESIQGIMVYQLQTGTEIEVEPDTHRLQYQGDFLASLNVFFNNAAGGCEVKDAN